MLQGKYKLFRVDPLILLHCVCVRVRVCVCWPTEGPGGAARAYHEATRTAASDTRRARDIRGDVLRWLQAQVSQPDVGVVGSPVTKVMVGK